MRIGNTDIGEDELCTASIWLDRRLTGAAEKDREAIEALAGQLPLQPSPSPLRRWSDHLRYRLGEAGSRRDRMKLLRIALRPFTLDYRRDLIEPTLRALSSLPGGSAPRPVRLLLRVDEFPHYLSAEGDRRYGPKRFAEFHEVLSTAGVAYALAALPRVARSPLSPNRLGSRALEAGEIDMLKQLKAEGVELALHGCDHRTRHASPHRHSELSGLDPVATRQLLDEATAELAQHGIVPRVFVAPFNRFDASQLELLGRRFDVVCGGPESIHQLGFQLTPQWRSNCIYLPSYAPFYGTAAQMVNPVRSLIERQPGIWVPLVLHWEWEQGDDWAALRRLAELIAPHTAPWSDLLGSAERARSALEAGSNAPVADGGDAR